MRDLNDNTPNFTLPVYEFGELIIELIINSCNCCCDHEYAPLITAVNDSAQARLPVGDPLQASVQVMKNCIAKSSSDIYMTTLCMKGVAIGKFT